MQNLHKTLSTRSTCSTRLSFSGLPWGRLHGRIGILPPRHIHIADHLFTGVLHLNTFLHRLRLSPAEDSHLPCTDFQSPLYEGLTSPVRRFDFPCTVK